MQISRAFEKTPERVECVFSFKEKYGLNIDSSEKLYNFDSSGKKCYYTQEEIEKMTNEKFDSAVFLAALYDCCCPGFGYSTDKQKEKLKNNIPIAIYCAEAIARQCAKAADKNENFEFNINDFADKLRYKIYDIKQANEKEQNSSYFIPEVPSSTEISRLVLSPTFVVVLNHELVKLNYKINDVNYNTNSGKILKSSNAVCSQIKSMTISSEKQKNASI